MKDMNKFRRAGFSVEPGSVVATATFGMPIATAGIQLKMITPALAATRWSICSAPKMRLKAAAITRITDPQARAKIFGSTACPGLKLQTQKGYLKFFGRLGRLRRSSMIRRLQMATSSAQTTPR